MDCGEEREKDNHDELQRDYNRGGAKPGRDWEATFVSWGAAPGPTEQTKCDNAERAVRKAISASAKLNAKSIEVFAQGSYANRTNVRQDSDVNVCVLCTDTFFPNYSMSEGLSDVALGHTDAPYVYAEFKNDVDAHHAIEAETKNLVTVTRYLVIATGILALFTLAPFIYDHFSPKPPVHDFVQQILRS
jgi:predicted nucleotidyltransferase